MPKRKSTCIQVSPDRCGLCCTAEDSQLGKFITAPEGLSAHYFCLLFSSGLMQNGDDDEGLEGFLVEDIKREITRAVRLRCTYCRKAGATIGCVVPRCRVVFHLPCGIANGALNQYFDEFKSYCREHRPSQQVPSSDRLAFVGTAKSSCSICMCPVDARASESTLKTPCCRNSWFHRDCIQAQANSSGLHFFKCPLCNNKEVFQSEMLQFGVYIPDQDASWERESQAYHELLERHSRCDVRTCKCPKGREHHQKNSKKWDLVLCDYCGSQGTHLLCSSLKTNQDDWVCLECRPIVLASKPKGKRGRRKKSAKKPKEVLDKDYLLKKMEKLAQGELEESDNSPKGKSLSSFSPESKTKCSPRPSSSGSILDSPHQQASPAKKARKTPAAAAAAAAALPSTPLGNSDHSELADSPKAVKSPRVPSRLSSPASKICDSPQPTKPKRDRGSSIFLQQRELEPSIDPSSVLSSKKRELRSLFRSSIHNGENLGAKFCDQFGVSVLSPNQRRRSLRINPSAATEQRSIQQQALTSFVASKDSTPKWLKQQLQDDIFTGKNLGQRFCQQFDTTPAVPSVSPPPLKRSKPSAAAGAPTDQHPDIKSFTDAEPASFPSCSLGFPLDTSLTTSSASATTNLPLMSSMSHCSDVNAITDCLPPVEDEDDDVIFLGEEKLQDHSGMYKSEEDSVIFVNENEVPPTPPRRPMTGEQCSPRVNLIMPPELSSMQQQDKEWETLVNCSVNSQDETVSSSLPATHHYSTFLSVQQQQQEELPPYAPHYTRTAAPQWTDKEQNNNKETTNIYEASKQWLDTISTVWK